MSGLKRFKEDIARVTELGIKLYYALYKEHGSDKDRSSIPKEAMKDLPNFTLDYQAWYSECLALILQILPERVDDFKAYYAPKVIRKEISRSNYTVSDCLNGLVGTQYGEVKFSPICAAAPMLQQYTIIQGLQNRFDSTLYDIKTLVHADLLDDELHSAEILNKNGFTRAAGAVAGVVLEGHLGAVVSRHAIKLSKSKPTIATFNDALKDASILDIPQWRFVQHLADIRNMCDHKMVIDPTPESVTELINGVRKITKTVF